MPYETHKGLLKTGEATLTTDIMPNNHVPNCHGLNQVAIKRIGSYTKTASMSYKLEYTELAIKQDSGYTFPFKNKDVHSVLMNSGIHKIHPNGSTGEEWFLTNLDMVKTAIKCVKEDESSISSGSVVKETPCTPIYFREEQKDTVEKTLKAFKKDNEMLWYQKTNRLVYYNLLERLLFHVKIAENPDAQANENELPRIGGAINFICKDLNDIYLGKEFTEDWRKTVAEKIKDSFDDYIAILCYFWNVIESNSIYKAIITKDMLCVEWDGKIVKKVMSTLNDGE